MDKDVIVVGAGIVGLAVARSVLIKRPNTRLIVLEKESEAGLHQSGHNSGVIHSGIYYKPGSLKAMNCVRGYKLLLDYLRNHNIAHDICGKIIVATNEVQREQLLMLKERGEKNGLGGLKLLSAEAVKEYEPHVSATEALLVPQAGIVDYRQVLLSYLNDVESMGGEVLFNQEVQGVSGVGEIITRDQAIKYKRLINCAGLYSDRLGRFIEADQKLNHQIVPIRGEYYNLRKDRESLVRNLIYPVPDLRFPFLGVHLTRMIGGGVEAGPNAVMALSREGYSWSQVSVRDSIEMLAWPGTLKMMSKYFGVGLKEVHRSLSKKAFADSLRRLVPEISENDLEPGGAGVRAQALHRDGRLLDDFLITQNERNFHVYNAPSPAATSSLAIAEAISERVVGEVD